MEAEKEPQKEELKAKVGQIVDRLIKLTEKGEISWKDNPLIKGSYTRHNGNIFIAYAGDEDWFVRSFLVCSEDLREIKINIGDDDFQGADNPVEKLGHYLYQIEQKVEKELDISSPIEDSEQLKNASEILDSLK